MALGLFGYGLFTTMHMPQGFHDYLIRCVTMPLSIFFCLDPFRERTRLSFIERIVCSLLLVLLVFLTPLFIYGAFRVRRFADR